MLPGFGVQRKLRDVAIVPAATDGAEGVLWLIDPTEVMPGFPGHHRDRAVAANIVHRDSLEVLRAIRQGPSLVHHDNGGVLAGGVLRLGNGAVISESAWDMETIIQRGAYGAAFCG